MHGTSHGILNLCKIKEEKLEKYGRQNNNMENTKPWDLKE